MGRALVRTSNPTEPAGVQPDRTHDLQSSLRALVGVVDRIGGYLSGEDQAVLWRARRLAGGR